MCEKKDVDSLVDMLDKLMSDGSGHINLKISDDDDIISVTTSHNTECTPGNKACCTPTIQKDTDE